MTMQTLEPETKAIPILFVNYFGTMGGGQIQLLALLDGLDRAKFTPHVVCCEDGGFIAELKKRGIEPVIIPFGKGKRRYVHVAWPAYWRMFRLIRKLGIRLVHANGLQEAKLAARPCAWLKIPLVWMVAT